MVATSSSYQAATPTPNLRPTPIHLLFFDLYLHQRESSYAKESTPITEEEPSPADVRQDLDLGISWIATHLAAKHTKRQSASTDAEGDEGNEQRIPWPDEFSALALLKSWPADRADRDKLLSMSLDVFGPMISSHRLAGLTDALRDHSNAMWVDAAPALYNKNAICKDAFLFLGRVSSARHLDLHHTGS